MWAGDVLPRLRLGFLRLEKGKTKIWSNRAGSCSVSWKCCS